jgi:lipoprotein-releasing system permease protein
VGLGVALMHVSTSVMGGFGHQIERMIIDTQGEIQVKTGAPINEAEAVKIEEALRGSSSVQAYAPSASGVVMIDHDRLPAFPAITGFDIDRMKQVLPLQDYIIAGSLEDLDDDSVILSTRLASNLGIRIGDTVSLYTPLMVHRMKNNEMLLPREVKVVGVFRIGHQQLDSSTVLCSLRLMQDLYGLGHMVHGYNVRLKPGADVYQSAVAIQSRLPVQTRAFTWFESNADFQAVLSFERNMIFFLLTFIVIVSAFSITSSLLVSVVRKTREIGLLGAMGGKAREVAMCFCAQGLVIGAGGTVVGLAGGWLLLHFRDALVQIIARLSMGREAFVKYYQFDALPAYTSSKDVITIIVFTLVAATLAGLIPAWRAARLKPVEALRSE